MPSPSEQRHKIEARCSENGWQHHQGLPITTLRVIGDGYSYR